MTTLRLVPFDLETTSLDTTSARIWSFGTATSETLLNPGVEIPEVIREKCHISPEQLEAIAAAPSWPDAGPELVEDLRKADAVLTQNGPKYDVPVLENEHHLRGPAGLKRVFDVRTLAFEAWPNLSNHKAGTVAVELGLVSAADVAAHSHEAQFDCGLVRLIWNRLPPKWTADLDKALGFQERAEALQSGDWERFGVTPEDGPSFLWFRTCRRCMGEGCAECAQQGFVHHTKNKRGRAVDAGYLRWLRKIDSCPAYLRGDAL